MRRLSVKLRVTLWYAALLVLMCAVLFAGIRIVPRRAEEEYVRATLESAAEVIIDDLRLDAERLELSDSLKDVPNVYAALFDAGGSLIYGRVYTRAAFSDGVLQRVSERGHSGYVLDRLLDAGGEDVWLRLYSSADASWGAQLSALRYGFWVFPALIAVALAGGWLLTARAFRPVKAMTALAASIADGSDLSRRVGRDLASSRAGRRAEKGKNGAESRRAPRKARGMKQISARAKRTLRPRSRRAKGMRAATAPQTRRRARPEKTRRIAARPRKARGMKQISARAKRTPRQGKPARKGHFVREISAREGRPVRRTAEAAPARNAAVGRRAARAGGDVRRHARPPRARVSPRTALHLRRRPRAAHAAQRHRHAVRVRAVARVHRRKGRGARAHTGKERRDVGAGAPAAAHRPRRVRTDAHGRRLPARPDARRHRRRPAARGGGARRAHLAAGGAVRAARQPRAAGAGVRQPAGQRHPLWAQRGRGAAAARRGRRGRHRRGRRARTARRRRGHGVRALLGAPTRRAARPATASACPSSAAQSRRTAAASARRTAPRAARGSR